MQYFEELQIVESLLGSRKRGRRRAITNMRRSAASLASSSAFAGHNWSTWAIFAKVGKQFYIVRRHRIAASAEPYTRSTIHQRQHQQ